MSGITYISGVVPKFTLQQSDFPQVIEGWSDLDALARRKVTGFSERVGVDKRNFIIPPTQVLELGGLAERAKVFEELGGELLRESVKTLLESSGVQTKQITHLIFTSCSVPIIPTLDTQLVEDLDFSPGITRIPMFQYGCAGGVFGIGLAGRFADAGGTVLVASAELCSLVFQGRDTSTAQLVGTSLFADGACSVLVTPDSESSTIKIVEWSSFLIPNSRHIMGYDLMDGGLHLRLDQGLPDTLTSGFAKLAADFLGKHQLRIEDIDHWLFHPGSVKIVEMLGEAINLRPEQFHWATDILREYGNMSSATILFVLERFVKQGSFKKGDRAVIAGVGPGLTIELILLEAQIDAPTLNV